MTIDFGPLLIALVAFGYLARGERRGERLGAFLYMTTGLIAGVLAVLASSVVWP